MVLFNRNRFAVFDFLALPFWLLSSTLLLLFSLYVFSSFFSRSLCMSFGIVALGFDFFDIISLYIEIVFSCVLCRYSKLYDYISLIVASTISLCFNNTVAVFAEQFSIFFCSFFFLLSHIQDPNWAEPES